MALALNNNHPIDVIYLDFSKAFDKVPHAALLLKLDHIGFRGQLLSWIKAYLSDRIFYVRVGDHFSDFAAISIGVPTRFRPWAIIISDLHFRPFSAR